MDYIFAIRDFCIYIRRRILLPIACRCGRRSRLRRVRRKLCVVQPAKNIRKDSFRIDKDTIISEYLRKNSLKNSSPFISIAYLIDIQLFIFMKGKQTLHKVNTLIYSYLHPQNEKVKGF